MYRVIIADDEPLDPGRTVLPVTTGTPWALRWRPMLEDGSDVLKLLEKERADVLLTDICMFQVSGLEAAGQIREKYPWMKVGAAVPATGSLNMPREAMRCQVYEYLPQAHRL